MRKKEQVEKTILSEILRFFSEEDYDYKDDYASRLALIFVESLQQDKSTFCKEAYKIRSNFFKVNRIKKSDFLQSIYQRLIKCAVEPIFPELQPLSIIDIFPEIKRVSENQITDIDKELNLKETIIQNAIRLAFRSKGSFPIARRDKDSPLEVADIEHFLIKLKGKTLSFTVVVKGQNSISGKKKKLNWQHISHQVTKAYNTHPDYIMIATAIEPVDRLITEMNLYALSVGKPNLIVFVPPVDLARFLSWRGII